MVEPIAPSDIADWSPESGIPDSVVEAYNTLIEEHYRAGIAIIYHEDVLRRLDDERIRDAFRNSRDGLGAVQVYMNKGWRVQLFKTDRGRRFMQFTK